MGHYNNHPLIDCICSECGKESFARVTDEGIGPYEYWGQRSVQHYWVVSSLCCGAECSDKDGNIIDLEYIQNYRE